MVSLREERRLGCCRLSFLRVLPLAGKSATGQIYPVKKIIIPEVREEYETLCDATGKPAVAGLVMWFWYGSSHDGNLLKVDMCDEVAEDVLKLLQTKYPQFKIEEDRMIMHCPLCGRHA
jgi:hypothetical protein